MKVKLGLQPEEIEPLLTPTEAGRIFGLCERSMRIKAQRGLIPSVKVGRRIMFRPTRLKQYLEKHEHGCVA